LHGEHPNLFNLAKAEVGFIILLFSENFNGLLYSSIQRFTLTLLAGDLRWKLAPSHTDTYLFK
jgi:hypothetical protein